MISAGGVSMAYRSALAVPLLLIALGAVPVAPAAAGTLVVANKSDATVSLVDTASGEVVATLPTGSGPHEVAVSPDGKTAVVSDYGTRGAPGSTLTVIDLAGKRVAKTIDLGEHTRPHGVAFLPGGGRAAVTAEGSKSLLVVDLETGKVETAIPTGAEVSHMVALSPGGERAYVANIGSGSVTVIDLAGGKKLGDVATGEGAEGIAATPHGVWVTNREADTVTLIDPETLKVTVTIPSPGFPIRAEATPDGNHVLVTNAEAGELTVIDAAERKAIRRVKLDLAASDPEGRLFGDRFGGSSVPIGIEIAPDGKTAWIAHSNADAVQVLDLETWKPTGVLEAGKEPDGMAYSPLTLGREGT
jgi:YVTN family beta-propeller protein